MKQISFWYLVKLETGAKLEVSVPEEVVKGYRVSVMQDEKFLEI